LIERVRGRIRMVYGDELADQRERSGILNEPGIQLVIVSRLSRPTFKRDEFGAGGAPGGWVMVGGSVRKALEMDGDVEPFELG
jgi:hypothetical protein